MLGFQCWLSLPLSSRCPARASDFLLLLSVPRVLHSWPWFYEFHNILLMELSLHSLSDKHKGSRIRVLVTLGMSALCNRPCQAVAWSCGALSHSLASLNDGFGKGWLSKPLNQAYEVFNERRIWKEMKYKTKHILSIKALSTEGERSFWMSSIAIKNHLKVRCKCV